MNDLVDRVRREVALARFVGKMAVDQGLREARSHLDDLWSTWVVPSDAPTPSPGRPDTDARVEETSTSAGTGPTIAADDLALADYDQLPASHIVAKLADLEPDERAAIDAYERAGRHRRTILTKIELLRDDAT